VSCWRRGGRGGLGSSLGRDDLRGGSSSFTSAMLTEQVDFEAVRSRGCYCLAACEYLGR
jgi:hypothetical protein